MPRYNRTFELTIEDVDLIEEALRARGRDLSQRRLELIDEDPANIAAVREVDGELREGEDLPGRLHDQKIFYRPRTGTYVSG